MQIEPARGPAADFWASSAERSMGGLSHEGPDAIDVRPKIDPVNWFLNGKDDVRSSYYLEDVATEFHIQGLELDWTCVTWDADFRYSNTGWIHKSFRGNRWENINSLDRQRYLKNAYRVLLTRARQGMVIVVPPGDTDDPTRSPGYYDATFEYLEAVGLPKLGQAGTVGRGVDEEVPKMTPGRAALLGLMRRSLAAAMDPSVSLLENAQEVASPPPWIDAFPRRDYNAGMITDLHEAKNNFGQLVRLAAEGEEIVITVSGRPAARLTSIAPREAIVSGRKQWADELTQVAETARAGAAKSTPQSFWDELREGPA